MSERARPVFTRPTTHRKARAIRRFRVTITQGPGAGTVWSEPAERCAIGSHPSNDLRINDATVSRFHCELTISEGAVRVRDLGSRNGTLLGGIEIADARVPARTTLELGDSVIRIDVEDSHAELAASERSQFGDLVGDTAVMREVFAQLEKVAVAEATVLIEGETGTGKEGVAEAIHEGSARAKGPFVVVDCGAIPANLLESELFGHEEGAFTGANDRRIGAFEQASGGTLFLDEIGELPLDLQPKLLRALESRRIRRVGGAEQIACDLRIVAATNRDLRAEVNRGTFRADLYFRLAVVKVFLPALRDRPDDIPLLVSKLLERLDAAPEITAQLMEPEFLSALSAAHWTGNVRELRNHLEQCVVFGERRLPNMPATPRPSTTVDESLPYEIARRQALDAFERDYLARLVAKEDGNVAAAARKAGLNRGYLHRMLRRHGLR